MTKNVTLKGLALASAFLLATTGTAHAITTCAGLVRAFHNKTSQVKNETAKYRTASNNMASFLRTLDKENHGFAQHEAAFVKEFTTLAQQAAKLLGGSYPLVNDVAISAAGATGAFLTPLITPAGPAAFTTTVNGRTIADYANFLYGDPATPGLSTDEVTRINRSRDLLLGKVQVLQGRMNKRAAALAAYFAKKTAKQAVEATKQARLQTLLDAQATLLYGVNAAGVPSPLTDTFTAGLVPPSVWGILNSLKAALVTCQAGL
jgi:hypothetical protein